LQTKLAVALSDLAACESTYPGYKDGYGYGASEFWGVQRTFADEYYGPHGYQFGSCHEELATVAALEKESCHVSS
jgi:hypothetical protein